MPEIQSFTSPLGAALGGSGIANNAASTITISGNFPLTLTLSGSTSVTLPTAGTLLSTAAAVTVPQGGSGAATLNGVLLGNGTNPFTAVVLPSDATQFLNGTGAFSTPSSAAMKTSGAGYALLPAGPALGTAITVSTTRLVYGSYVQMRAAAGNALYIVGIAVTGIVSHGSTDTVGWQIAVGTGTALSETQVGEIIVSLVNVTPTGISGPMIVFPYAIPIAAGVRIALKAAGLTTANNNPADPLVTLWVIDQSLVS